MVGKLLKILLVVNLIILDVFVGLVFYKQYIVQEQLPAFSENEFIEKYQPTPSQTDSTCSIGCISYFNENIKTQIETGQTPVVQTTPIPTIITKTISVPGKDKVKDVSYVPIPGSGNTLRNDWIDLAGTDFYMSTSDYPGIVGVYFEANMRLQNGNGKAYARIYDVTNSRGVDGSEISTSSQTSEFVGAGPITLWAGFNHYIVQVKSLTADTAVFETGKLKIVTEN